MTATADASQATHPLIAQFNRLADLPDSVPRLRQFILDLAVRGKLVNADDSDDTAGQLVEEIAAERRRLIKEGELRKDPSLPELADDELPVPLPQGWRAIRMGLLAQKLGAGSTPLGGKTVYQSEGVPFLRSQNVHDDGLRLDDVARIPRAVHDRMSGTHVRTDDVLLNITGASIGRCALVPPTFEEGNVSQHVAIIRLVLPVLREFVHLLLISPVYQKMILDAEVGVSREGLSMQRLRLFPVLIPPLAEQRRIVAKVDELMALCDRLEAAKAERERRRDRLVAASLSQLNSPPSADGTDGREGAAFYVRHFSDVAARTAHVDELRRSILNLAVQGRLVRQGPDDEPTDKLLRRVRADQEARGFTLRQRRNGGLGGPADNAAPFDVPNGWEWVPLKTVMVFGPQNGISPEPSTNPDNPKAVTLTATTSGRFDGSHYKHVEAAIPADSEFWLRPGDLLFQRGNTREYVGIAAYYTGEPNQLLYPDLMIKVRLSEHVDLRYVHLAATAPHAREYFGRLATGAQTSMPKINHAILVDLPIPLPSLAEQRRIVEKVDELMALCDRLEAALERKQAGARRLLESLLHQALHAPA